MNVYYRTLLIVLAFSLCSCSAGFNRSWKAAESSPAPSGIEGRWSGTWNSKTTGHQGKLKCVVSPTGIRDRYQFHYAGTFAKVLKFQYKVSYSVNEHRDHWDVTGESDLGWMGGVFSHKGVIKDGVFKATYASKKESGEFLMHRLK